MKTMKNGWMIAAFVSALIVSAAPAATEEAARRLVIPRLPEVPKIDGTLDNPVWEHALKIENFVQLSPKENGVPSEKTVAYLGYDEKNLYIAFRCYDSQPGKIRASITTRDNIMEDDWIIVFLDTFNEKRRAFSFFLNPYGIQMDAMRMEEGGNDNMDPSWDTVFYSDGKINDDGYTVEAAIPFKSLRFPPGETQVWNIVLGRTLQRTGEVILWPGFSREIPGLLTQGRPFVIEGPVERGKNLEIMPVLTSLKREGDAMDVQPGINLKYGVSSNMTLDFTLNPDFSHIETDAPQIDYNLRYALRYQEKRPFFLEGMEIFQFPEIEMVYTRRIIDPLWGAKASGKMGRFTYGLISAWDRTPTESLWDVHNGGSETHDAALFNIARIKADVGKGSYMGFSLADKQINGSWNRAAGLDGQFRYRDRLFFSFQALASKTSYDGDQTDFAPALYGELYYFTKNWSVGGFWKSLHPDFEASSGFINRVDYRSAGGFASYRIYTDKPYLNQVQLRLQAGRRFDYFGSGVQDDWLRANVQFRLTEFNQVFLQFENGMERFAGVDFQKTGFSANGQLMLIRWMPFHFFFRTGNSINYDPDDAFLGYSNTYGLSLNFKPSQRVQAGLDLTKQTFWREWGGEQLWDYNVIRQRTTYQLSKSLSLRAIVDYNHFYKKMFGSFLVSYVLRPGTLFFLGFDSNYIREMPGAPYDRQNYSVFVKFSYWLRI
jgi:hypothetical protein